MPEGHTLHALADRLDHAYAGRPVSASSPQGRFVDGAALLDGRIVSGAWAYGKQLFVDVAGDLVLHVHLGLIGKFTVLPTAPAVSAPPVWGQVRLRLLNGDFVADLRGAVVCAVITPPEVHQVLARLGPDPLRSGADPELAWARIVRSGRPIAELLMDQSVLAGVGNVYRCEVLFRHRVDPFRPGRQIRRTTFSLIWEDLVALLPLGVVYGQILTMADQVEDAVEEIAAGGVERSALTLTGERLGERFERRFWVYKRTGEPCRVCGSRIRTRVVAGRNLFWCGRCQRRR